MSWSSRRAADPQPESADYTARALATWGASRGIAIHFGLMLVIGSLLLLWPAILNGYPLLYWDTGAYIWTSLDHLVPPDRPIAYGLLLGATRVVPSLWTPIALQALGTAYLVLRTAMLVIPGPAAQRAWLSLAVLALTALTTGVARYVSFVMPDIFAAWILLAGMLLLFSRQAPDRVVASLAIVIAVLVHNANLLLGVTFGAALLMASACIHRPISRHRLVQLAAVLAVAAPAAGLLNWGFGAGFTLSRGAPTFMLNRLAAAGVLSATLETYCSSTGWQLCASQALIREPHRDPGWWFLWGADSPLQVLGWEQAGGGEQSDVAAHALRCCWRALLSSSAEQSWQQLQMMSSSEDLPVLDGNTSAFRAIRARFPDEFGSFMTSRQESAGQVAVRALPGDQPLVYASLALAALMAAVWCWRRHLPTAAVFVGAALGCVVLNAVVTGALNGAADRQQGRVAWLLPCAFWAASLALARTRSAARA